MNLSLTQRRNYFKVIDMVASQLLTMHLLTTQLLTTVASQLLQKSHLICCEDIQFFGTKEHTEYDS
jgi:predicted transcriptional regulator